jgi:hypothetical protein
MTQRRVAVIVGVIVLLATGALHLSAYSEVSTRVSQAGMPVFWQQAVKGSWVYFSMQLFAIAAAAAFFGLRRQVGKEVLRVCAAMLVMNVVVLLAFVGVFAGAVLVALAAAALIVAAI